MLIKITWNSVSFRLSSCTFWQTVARCTSFSYMQVNAPARFVKGVKTRGKKIHLNPNQLLVWTLSSKQKRKSKNNCAIPVGFSNDRSFLWCRLSHKYRSAFRLSLTAPGSSRTLIKSSLLHPASKTEDRSQHAPSWEQLKGNVLREANVFRNRPISFRHQAGCKFNSENGIFGTPK